MNVTIIGGGNIGTLLAADIARKNHSVTVYTPKADKWNYTISVYNSEEEFLFSSKLYLVTDDMEKAINDAQIILVTLPAYMFDDLANKMLPYIKSNQFIGFFPGSGGVEYAFKKFIERNVTIFGFQRVHSIARLKEYGKAVYELGRKDILHMASIPCHKAESIAQIMSEMLDIKCVSLINYLSVTLTPSNPILHTTRLYSIFKNYMADDVYPLPIPFYENWNDDSSEILFACDNELQDLCKVIPLELNSVISLKEHYESYTPHEMTIKINNIAAFKGIMTPMIFQEDAYIPDWQSRYFTADFSYGLKIIYDISRLFEIDVPNIKMVWEWYKQTTPLKKLSYFELNMTKKDFMELYKK